jgi:quinol monooxygenase YgiN
MGPAILSPGSGGVEIERSTEEKMALVSITRFRVRAWWFVPIFAFYAQRSIAQIRNANGCMALALLKDRNRVFWTMTLWEDERSMNAYRTSGSHRKVMPRLADWADEASMVHWYQDHSARPDWIEAARRMRAEGRPSKLRHPGPHHADLSFPPPSTTSDTLFENYHRDTAAVRL